MKALPHTEDLLAVARHVIWFEPPENALSDTVRFLAYLTTYGTAEEIAVVRRYADDATFKKALDRAPPGIMDARSWVYWNIMADRYPAPPMPRREASCPS